MLLQAIQTAADMAVNTSPIPEPEKLSLFALAVKGGWIMIPIALMLILAVYIFIERLITINKASKEDSSFMNRIKDYIYEGKIESALKLCRDNNSPSARMIEKGISRLGRPMSDVLVAIENVGNLEIAKLEKGLVIMASIAGGGPMVGFFGTIVGMVEVFYEISSKSGGVVNLNEFANGLYVAMVTTVGGLVVGILAYFAYNYLVSRVDAVMRKLENNSMEFLDLLNEPASK